MTAPRSTLRQRRRSTADNLPRALADWFEGVPRGPDQSSVPWLALIYPDYVLLPERWLIWKAAHPGAHPPVGYEWLDDPTSPRHSPEWLLIDARKCAAHPHSKAR